ncbi:MAG TPA: sulfatase-like hydrolase/transferase [Terracidiphilus sp.]|nr:sulfatase-like hydrolase/transferase [Terracidiphilus sp.]
MMKRLAQAWGFASILLLPDYIDLTSQAGDARMRVPSPLTKIALAHLVDMLIVGLLFALLMAALRRSRRWPAIRWILVALLPPMLFVRNLNVMPTDIPNSVVIALNLAWIVVVAILVWRFARLAVTVRKAGSVILSGSAVFAMVMTVQIGREMLWRPGPQAYAHPIAAAPASKPRLVWVIFDELGYKQTFEARDPSLNLPDFDLLRSESTIYTDVTPIAYRTTRAVPTLMLGRAVTDVEYTNSNKYLVQIEDKHWEEFDPEQSLIGLARQHGVTTSIIGWYIAYCPVFEKVATECYWSNDDAQDRGPTMLDESFAANVWFPLRMMVEQFVWPSKAWADDAAWNERGHIASVKDVSLHALETLAASQADIIYLHIPAPHPPGFWDRRTGKFAVGGSYADGLDYSDRLLGQMLAELEKQPRWASTTLLVQGDHSWRTAMWRPLPGWSAEDERISHGGEWDPRPVLMIHSAGQQNTKTVAAATSLMYVHDFVAQWIRNQGSLHEPATGN